MWLETVVLIEAAAAFWLSMLNVMLLGRAATEARGRPRRAAAFALACVCGAHAMEALLFLWLGDASMAGAWPAVALVVVRTVLLLSTLLISLLLLRALSLPR